MTKDGSVRGLRSLFGRRRRISQEHPALTPMTIYQVSDGSAQAQREPQHPVPSGKVYPSSPEDVEVILASGPAFEEPSEQRRQTNAPEDESLEMLEDGDEDDGMSPATSCGDIGDSRPSRTYSRPQPPSISHNPSPQPPSGKRNRRDSVTSISSVRSWRSLFRLSQSSTNDRGAQEDQEIKRTGSVSSIRSLAISSPVAIQASTSSAVEIGTLPQPSKPLRARASSPAMTQQARFEQRPPVPLRNALETDDDHGRRQLLHSAVSHASHSPTLQTRDGQGSGRQGGFRKRSSSIASLSSLFGAAIGIGSRNRERVNSGAAVQPVSAPGIALSNSTTSFTILSAPQGPAPLNVSKKGLFKPITVQPAAPAVSGLTSGADLGCAPKHSLASSADAEGKSSKRWKFRSRRKTAEVTAQTLKAMTQSRAVELNDYREREGPEGSSPSLASSSALGVTVHSQFDSNSSDRTGFNSSPVSQPYEDEGPRPTSSGLLSRWANQLSGRTRLSSTNSALSYNSDVRSNPSSAEGYAISQQSGAGNPLMRQTGNHIGQSPDAMEIASNGPPSHAASSPGSLNHWLTDLDLNIQGPYAFANSQAHNGINPNDNKRMFGDLPDPRTHQALDDMFSVQSNNGSAESVVFLIKPTAEPMAPDAEANGGPRPQLSRRSTRDSARNSMKATANEHRLSTRLSGSHAGHIDRICEGLPERSDTVKQDLHTAQASTSSAVADQSQTPAKAPPLPERFSSRNQLPTRSSAVSQLCSLQSDIVSHSYDDETEVVAHLDTERKEGDQAELPFEDQQGMESQQVDPWSGSYGNLGLVAESDSAAAVIAEMMDSSSNVSIQNLETRPKVMPASPIRQLSTVESISPVEAEDDMLAAFPVLSSREAMSVKSGQDELFVSEMSIDISATSCDVVFAQKIVIEAVALNTLPAALSPTPAERPVEPRAEVAIPTHATITGLAISSNHLVGATVEQAVEVTASLANLGSMSMISNASSMLAVRNSLEAPEPLTPSEPMATPSLRSGSFSSSSTEASSDSLCSISHRADYGGQLPGSMADIASTPFKSSKTLAKEEDHFDQWGSAPNGLMIDLSMNGKPAPQHFEDAVRSFQDRQRQHSRTQTTETEGWTELGPLLGVNSALSLPVTSMMVGIDAAGELSPVKPSRSRPLAPSMSILNSAQGRPTSSIGSKLVFALPRHKSGNAIGYNVQISATMPEILQQKVALEGKRASVPNGLVSLNEFLTELKTPVDLARPPPPLLQARRHSRSKTSDGTTEHRARRTRTQSAQENESPHEEQKGEGLSSRQRRRVRTTSASTTLRSNQPTTSFYPGLGVQNGPTSLPEEEEGDDSSLIRLDWQQFALGRIGATLRNVELDADASHRAMHTQSPPRSKAAATAAARVSAAISVPANRGRRSDGSDRILSLLEDYEDERDRSEGSDSLRPDEAPRSSTPSPMVSSAASPSPSRAARLNPVASALRKEIRISPSETEDTSGALSEMPSTAMARCHEPLEEESAFDVLQPVHKTTTAFSDGTTQQPPLVRVDKVLPAVSSDDDEIKLLGVCLSLVANAKPSGTRPIADLAESSIAAASAGANTSIDASTNSNSGVAYFSADLSSETEMSTVDIVEHLLRKAMWARYEKEAVAARRKHEEGRDVAASSTSAIGEEGGKQTPSIPRLAVTDVDEGDLELD
ncbi:hypothetical protein A4X06_0g147 [Tilletia controversa]|uniref:Uncharacterized protein n=1 Tax=Tilletia controversa TaxID=13291 RepID=A0A8X7T0E8_9BASI|nr:hypothetical protein CF328_g241 [Tilletia controversa]KAE8255969.1 hypothetical protein A4X06_0g147 [Tilletia controversa]